MPMCSPQYSQAQGTYWKYANASYTLVMAVQLRKSFSHTSLICRLQTGHIHLCTAMHQFPLKRLTHRVGTVRTWAVVYTRDVPNKLTMRTNVGRYRLKKNSTLAAFKLSFQYRSTSRDRVMDHSKTSNAVYC